MSANRRPSGRIFRQHRASPYSRARCSRANEHGQLAEVSNFEVEEDLAPCYSGTLDPESIDNYDFERLSPQVGTPSQISISLPVTPARLEIHRTHAFATLQNCMRVHWERSTFKHLRRRARTEDDSNADVIRRTGGTGWECRRLMSPEMEERESGMVPWGPVNGDTRVEPVEFPSFESYEEGEEGPWLHDINGSTAPFDNPSDPSEPLPHSAPGFKPPPIPIPIPLSTAATDPLPPRHTGFRLDTRKCVDPRAPVRPMPWSNDHHEPEEPSEYLEEYWKWSGREYGYAGGEKHGDETKQEGNVGEKGVTEHRQTESGSWMQSFPLSLPWPFKHT